jgi:hypothetical protein
MLWIVLLPMLWLGSLLKFGALGSTVPPRQRALNAFFTFILTVGNGGEVIKLFRGIFYGVPNPEHYFRQVGAFPPWLVFVSWLGSSLSGIVAIQRGFAVTQRKASGRSITRWIPFIAVFTVIEAIGSAQARHRSRGATEELHFLIFSLIFSLAMVGSLYGWMYFFYRSKKMDGYFLLEERKS